MWADSTHDWANNVENIDSKQNIARRDEEKEKTNNANNEKFDSKGFWKDIHDLLSPLLDIQDKWITENDLQNIIKRVI